MKNFLISIVFTIALLFSCSTIHYNYKTAPMAESTMAVEVLNPFTGEWTMVASAFALKTGWNETKLVTARHVAENVDILPTRVCSLTEDDDCNYLFSSAEILPEGDELSDDWAVYDPKYIPESVVAAKFQKRPLKIGQKVFVVGNPIGVEGEVTSGMITNMDGEGTFIVDARVLPGNSGGPVFNNYGRVVGIVSAIYGAQGIGPVPTYGVCVDIHEVTE